MIKKILLFGCWMIQYTFSYSQEGIRFGLDAASWESVVEQAQQEKKPIFVDIYTEWCGPCKWMDQNVFNQRQVGAFMNERYVNLKLDAEKGWGREFVKTFGVSAYPTYLFFSPEGDLIFSSGGSKPASAFLKNAEYAIGNLQAGISIKGMEALLENKNPDPEQVKLYLDRLGGEDPRISYLLDLFLNALPETSLITEATLKMIKTRLNAPVNFHSKAFGLLMEDYNREPMRTTNIMGSWMIIKTLVEVTVDSAGRSRDHSILRDALTLQDKLYGSTRLSLLNQGYLETRYHANSGDEHAFIKQLEKFINDFYLHEGLEPILAFDEEEFLDRLELEFKTRDQNRLTGQQLDRARKTDVGIIRQQSGYLSELVTMFKNTFPETFRSYQKQDLDKGLQFGLDLYAANRVYAAPSILKSKQRFLNMYKEIPSVK